MSNNYQPLENEGHAIHIIDENVERFCLEESMF